MKALLSLGKRVIEVTGKDEEELLMHLKDQIINRLDDAMDAIMEDIEDEESENCTVDLHGQYDQLQREHDRVRGRDDVAGLRHMGYIIQPQ